MTKEAARFPITVWPGQPLEVPPVARREVRVTAKGFLVWSWAGVEECTVPEELFLRGLLDLDVDERDDVVDFVRAHGSITDEYVDRGLTPDDVLRDLYRPVGRKAPEQLLRRRPADEEFASNHVLDLIWWLKTARSLTRHWLAVQEGTDVTKAWQSEGFIPYGRGVVEARTRDGVRRTVKDRVWQAFVDYLNVGLRPFHVRVEADLQGGRRVGAPAPQLYSVLCLQLANYLAEDATARRCASETCGRPFVRQLGGALFGQYRTEGVLYCTTNCAKAQAQREYRRRGRRKGKR